MDSIATTAARKPLHVWPGMVLGMLFLLVRSGLPLIGPDFTIYGGPPGTPTLNSTVLVRNGEEMAAFRLSLATN